MSAVIVIWLESIRIVKQKAVLNLYYRIYTVFCSSADHKLLLRRIMHFQFLGFPRCTDSFKVGIEEQ